MHVQDLTKEEAENSETLFPLEIEKNLWVCYHGTSSIAERAIDEEGLRYRPSLCSRGELEQVVRIFKSIDWPGTQGGYPIIDAYSLQNDFGATDTKPVFLRELPTQSLSYAGGDLAGGESAAAVRRAFVDLDKFLNDKTVRDRHLAERRETCIRFAKDDHPPRVIEVDLDWLTTQLENLQDLRERCERARQDYAHGVLYAVEFKPEDLPHVLFSSTGGLHCFTPLAKERIVGKIRIFGADGGLQSRKNDCLKMIARNEAEESLIQALEQETKRYPDRFSHRRPNGPQAHQLPNFRDVNAGTDLGPAIAQEYRRA